MSKAANRTKATANTSNTAFGNWLETCREAWAQNQAARVVLNHHLVEDILTGYTKSHAALALAGIDGRQAKWPMRIEDAQLIVAILTEKPTEDANYMTMRQMLSDFSRDHGVHYAKVRAGQAAPLVATYTVDQIRSMVKSEWIPNEKNGQENLRLRVFSGENIDPSNPFSATTGTVVLHMLLRALWVTPDLFLRQYSISLVLRDFFAFEERLHDTSAYMHTETSAAWSNKPLWKR